MGEWDNREKLEIKEGYYHRSLSNAHHRNYLYTFQYKDTSCKVPRRGSLDTDLSGSWFSEETRRLFSWGYPADVENRSQTETRRRGEPCYGFVDQISRFSACQQRQPNDVHGLVGTDRQNETTVHAKCDSRCFIRALLYIIVRYLSSFQFNCAI